ncbi:hypothetical protein OTU49_009037, partial [Cherax quadricarinatus]
RVAAAAVHNTTSITFKFSTIIIIECKVICCRGRPRPGEIKYAARMMTRIAALNDWSVGSSEEEDIGPTREALEAEATKSYNEAIRYLAHENLEEAHKHFCQVLQNPYIEKACWSEGVKPGGTLPQDLALRYSCLKNLGNLASKQGKDDEAAKYYLEAVQVDSSEVILWQRLGATAIKLKDFELALVAFQEGLNVNPKHWPCLDQLLSVLFILEMYMDCLGLVISALARDPGYIKANAFKDRIFELQPSLVEDVKFFYRDSSVLFKVVDYDKTKGEKFIATCESLRPPSKTLRPPSPFQLQRLRKPMSKLSWVDLGQALVLTYDHLVEADGLEFAARIDVHDALKPKVEDTSMEIGNEGKNAGHPSDANTDRETVKENLNEGRKEASFETGDKMGTDTANKVNKEKNDYLKNGEENNPDNKYQDDKGEDKIESNMDHEKMGSEEKQNISTPKLSEGLQESPPRISSRRCTIELGESQDSFRVGEKRRSIDSDTFSRPDDDLKGSEDEGSAQQKLITVKESSTQLCSSKVAEISEDQFEKESSIKKKDANFDCIIKTTETQCTGMEDPNSKVLNTSVESENDFQGFTNSPAHEDRVQKLAKESHTLDIMAKKDNDVHKCRGSDNVILSMGVQRNIFPEEGSTREKGEISKSLYKEVVHDDSVRAGAVDNPGELCSPEKDVHDEVNLKECKEIRSKNDSGVPQELEKANVNANVCNITDVGLIGKDNERMQVAKDNRLTAESHSEEGALSCEGSEQEDEDAEEMIEDKNDDRDEELEEPEEGEDCASRENEMLQEEEEGLEEGGTVSSEVTETEAAVNALKGIMALQPTEILGLPETDFDYDNEYDEYFDGGVYEEDDDDMIQEEGMDAEDGLDQEDGMEQEDGIDQDAIDQEDVDQREGIEQDCVGHEGIEQDCVGHEGIEQEEDLEQEGMEQEERTEQEDDIEQAEQEGTEQEGIEQEGTEQEGTEQEGTEQEGTEQEGTEQEGTEQEGTEQEGTEQEGTEQEGTEQEGTEQGTEQEGIEQDGTDQEGTEQDGTDQEEGTEQEGVNNEDIDQEDEVEQDRTDQEDEMDQEGTEQEEEIDQEGIGQEEDNQEETSEQEEDANALDEDLEEQDETEREGVVETEEDGDIEEEDEEEGQENEIQEVENTADIHKQMKKTHEVTGGLGIEKTDNEGDNVHLKSNSGMINSLPKDNSERVKVSKDSEEKKSSSSQNGQSDTVDEITGAEASDKAEESQSQISVGNKRKSKRHKRGLERELEQLDYWGRRQERDAKRRRRTISSKLLGTVEEAEYLTWADLFRSFVPTSLLDSNSDDKTNKKELQQNTCPDRSIICKATQHSNPGQPDNSEKGSVCDVGSTAKNSEMDLDTQKRANITDLDVSKIKEENVEGRPESEAHNKYTDKDKCKDSKTEIKKMRDVDILSSATEEAQVEAFLLRHEENGGILDLSQQFLQILFHKHGKLWPLAAAKMFIEIYPRVRNHVCHRPVLNLQENRTLLYQDSILSLTHWELAVSLYQISKINTSIVKDCQHLEDDMVHLTLMLGRGDVWVEETPNFHTRLRWLQAQIKLSQEEPEEAVLYLELLLADLNRLVDAEKEYIVDCARIEADPTVVSNSEVKRQLNFLQRSQMLEQVVGNYTDGHYQVVVDLLTAIFHESPPKPRPGVTLPTRQTQLAILIDSLYKLKNHKDVIVWGSQSLTEALYRYNRAEAEEEKNRWAKTLMKICDTINTTLEKNMNAVCDIKYERLVELVSTLIQMLVVQLDRPQNAQVLPFETLTPWILLHRLLAHEERLQKQSDTKTDIQEGKEKQMMPTTGGELSTMQQNLTKIVNGSGFGSEGREKPRRMNQERASQEVPAESKGSRLPYPSTLFLITAHDELGKHSWCCYDDGIFLLYCLNVLLVELRRPLEDQHQQLLHQTLEQVSFCLYSHPSKKSKHKHLRDHGASQITFSWERALQLYQYYCPNHLPDFQSSQIPSITDDVATLHKRIIALLPEEVNPENHTSRVEAYISGEQTECNYTPVILPSDIIRDCFYLLGDYYFKNKEWTNAIKYYKLDVTMNPDRLDSWAPLGLAMKAMLETQLNSCEVIQDEEDFFSLAQTAVRCLKQALKLDEYHTNLWVEFGGLVYMVHSHASRLLKQDLNPDISLETFQMLEKLKGEMLDQAERCFTQALKIREEGWDDENLPDERWLYCYMLGKVGEKKGKSSETILQYYLKAGRYLHEQQAKYPTKINYNSPQEYSVEALEMYYRPHAYILKYLQQREGKSVEEETVKFFTKILDELAAGAFASRQEKKKISDEVNEKLENNLPSQDTSPNKRSLDDQENEKESPFKKVAGNGINSHVAGVKDAAIDKAGETLSKTNQCMEDKNTETRDNIQASGDNSSLRKETNTILVTSPEKDKRESDDEIQVVEEKVIEKKDHMNVIGRCITALKLCLSRFPENYKALFRLAYYYNTSKFHKDCTRSRNYLLGCEFWQRVPYMPVNGLFNERKVWIQQPKNCNFFHGVWRIPNDEVDRPGSFASHMYRCVSLTLDVLPQIKDFYTILQIALALKNSPEKDKKYLRDNERELLSEHATQVGLQAMKDKYKCLFKSASPVHGNRRLAFLLDVYRSYKQISRHLPGSEPHLAKMLTEAYCSYRGMKLDNRSNILREADAFCTRNQYFQHRTAPIATSNQVNMNSNTGISGTSQMSRRGRFSGTGRGRGFMYPVRQSSNMTAIQEAYKIYENLIQAQTLLNNKDLDHGSIYTHQKQLEYYQAELLKYLRIPSVSQYFQASLQGLGTATTKLPPPPKTTGTPTSSALSAGGTFGHQGAKTTMQMLSTTANHTAQSIQPGQSRPALNALAARSQAHGISITSVSASKSTTSVTSKPLKPNMTVTVSPAKPSCSSALQDHDEISVVSVSHPIMSSRPSPASGISKPVSTVTSKVTTTTTSKPATTSPSKPTTLISKSSISASKPETTTSEPDTVTSKPDTTTSKSDTMPTKPTSSTTESPTSTVHRPTPIMSTNTPLPKTVVSESTTVTVNTSRTTDSAVVSSVPKLPVGTTLSRPRPQLQAQARPVKSPVSDSVVTRPSTTISSTKHVASGQVSKPSLSKDIIITPAPRVKSHPKPLVSVSKTASPSSFLGAYQASLGLGGNKAPSGRAGGSNSSCSARAVTGSERQSSSLQLNKSVVLNTSQLMELAYTRGASGNISGLLNQYSKTQPVRGQSRPQGSVLHQSQPSVPQRSQASSQRQQPSVPQRPQSLTSQRQPVASQRPQASTLQRFQQPRTVQQTRPSQIRQSPSKPIQNKPSQGQSGSSEDIITLD